jgi:hypothetical protein
MAASCFITWNGVIATSTPWAPLTGVAPPTPPLRTLLQVGGNAKKWRIIEWGYNFTTAPTGLVTIDLVETAAIAATVTAGTIFPYNDANGSSLQTTTTSTTGFTSSAEGSIVAAPRLLGMNIDTAMYFKQQYPQGREPEIAGGNICRLRFTSTVASLPLVVCYIIWEE